MNSDYRIGFCGFGHMAQIIFEAINRAKVTPRSHILFCRRDTHKMKENEQRFGITSTSLANLIHQSDVIFLCMRPQQVQLFMEELKKVKEFEGKWFVSILAGTKISYFQTHLGPKAQILRALPNVGSAVTEGMTIMTYSPECCAQFQSFANILFGSMGEIAELPESLTDIACGMAGSAIGFVFRLIEAEARLGEKHGMNYAQALKIAAQAFAGAARLILKGGRPTDLMHTIATPNGVTQAGFEAMTKLDVDHRFQAVIEAAANRSRELSS